MERRPSESPPSGSCLGTGGGAALGDGRREEFCLGALSENQVEVRDEVVTGGRGGAEGRGSLVRSWARWMWEEEEVEVEVRGQAVLLEL